jgi:hypothetical protein
MHSTALGTGLSVSEILIVMFYLQYILPILVLQACDGGGKVANIPHGNHVPELQNPCLNLFPFTNSNNTPVSVWQNEVCSSLSR